VIVCGGFAPRANPCGQARSHGRPTASHHTGTRNPPKAESFVVLEGELAFFIFDDAGKITSVDSRVDGAWFVSR